MRRAISLGRAELNGQAHHGISGQQEECQSHEVAGRAECWARQPLPTALGRRRLQLFAEAPARAGLTDPPGKAFTLGDALRLCDMPGAGSGSPGQGVGALGLDAEGVLRVALDSLPSGVVLVAGGGTIVLANHQLERQFGYAHGELLGQPVEVLLPDALSTVARQLSRSIHAGADCGTHAAQAANCSGSAATGPGLPWKSL